MFAKRRPWAHPNASDKVFCVLGAEGPLLHGKPSRISLRMRQRTHTLVTAFCAVQGLIEFDQEADELTTAFATIAATHPLQLIQATHDRCVLIPCCTLGASEKRMVPFTPSHLCDTDATWDSKRRSKRTRSSTNAQGFF